MVTTDEQLISLTHAMKNCPVIKSNKEYQASERGSTSRKMIDNLGEYVWSYHPRLVLNRVNKTVNLHVIGHVHIDSIVTVTVAIAISS